MTPPESTPGDAWLDRFFETRFRRRPVDATFVGVRGHDHRLPDVSPGAVDEEIREVRELLATAPADGLTKGLDGGLDHPLEALGAVDRRLAVGDLRIRLWELESRWQLRNPSAHVGEVVFGLMSLMLPGSAPRTGAVEALGARLHDVERYLTDARAHVVDVPQPWAERALRECRGGLAFLHEGLAHAYLGGADPERADGADRSDGDTPARPALAAATRDAARAIEAFAEHVRSNTVPDGRVSCGADAFALHLREGHFLSRTADEIAAYAREEIESTKAWLAAAAPEYGAPTPEAVLAALPGAHPTADGYLARFDTIWQEMKQLAEARALVTWPDFPIRYSPRPVWSQAAAPDLYFLFYRSPAAFDRPPVHDYMVAPLPEGPGGDEPSTAELETFLRANNDSVIKLNHVVHHGGIGHHVQNWHAFRSPLRVGRVAAVDCASRIAMFCGGTMAEGWACYATDLMAEAGGLSPTEVFAEHAGRIRMAARAVVDVELHHGRMSLDEAADFYRVTAGMSEAAARAEAVKNSMFPGAALMYLVGTDMVHELRADLVHALRDRFVLRDFHDAFLSYGSIPVRIVADEMRARARHGIPLGAHDHPAGAHDPLQEER